MSTNNIVVFDLDETLGNFTQLSIFWEALNKYHNTTLSEDYFFKLLDTFPEFLRPNIYNILKYLLKQKRNNKCDNIMIYTNNQGNKKWVTMITRYFDMKLKQQTFDKIISAFKVRGKQIELCRTTHDKSVSDLFRCTKIPENTQICFIDDQLHPLMKHDNVYYINVKPYNYSIDFEKMTDTYYTHNIKTGDKKEFIKFMTTHMNKSGYLSEPINIDEHNVDKIISKQLLIHLRDFFKSKNKTKRVKRNRKNRTVKL
jgi:hypothetical protein|tara:strand:+ start:216 stop:983 length:768 start_codon:yes stop_codon:yes gene_type:complete